VHNRLFTEKIKNQKNHLFTKTKYKGREEKVLDLTNIKKPKQEVQKTVDKLIKDANDRKKKKAEDTSMTFEEPYDIDNIASHSSKNAYFR